MKIDLVIEFILSGLFFNIPFGSHTTRMVLIGLLGFVEGIKKKNGTHEILKKDDVYYYVGHGSRGSFLGIRISGLLKYNIEPLFVENLLKTNNILYIADTDGLVFSLENGVKIYFQIDEVNKTRYMKEVLKTENKEIDKILLGVKN